MPLTLLLSEEEYKDFAPAAPNVQFDSPGPQVIYAVQREQISPVICEDLYKELLAQVEDNSLTALNLALLEYIKPALAWQAFVKHLAFAWLRLREAGPVIQMGQNVQTVGSKDLQVLRNEASQTAGSFMGDLVRYLQDNRKSYPLYNCDCCDGATDTRATGAFFSYI